MIEILPSSIVISNYTLNDSKTLENSLSVWNKVTFEYTLCLYLYDEENMKLIIPGGYSIDKLKKYLPKKKIVDKRFEYNDFRELKELSLKLPPNKKIQEIAIDFLIGNSYSKNSTQKLLMLNTGEGKTYCAINYIFRTKRLPMIMVDQESLALQWIDSIKKFTNADDNNIYYISGKSSITKLYNMKKSELKKINFFVAIHRTINNIASEDLEELAKLFKYLEIGIKIFDEAHVEYNNIFLIDSLTNIPSIYLTATPARSNESENKVYQNMFNDIKRMASNTTIGNKNYHNIVIVKTNSHPSIENEAECKSRYGFDNNRFSKYILNEKYDYFFNIITKLLDEVVLKKKRKVAILLHINDLVDTLYNDICDIYIEKGYNVGKFNSSIKNKDEKKLQLEKDIIITTDMSFSKGIDTKDLECVINTVPLSSKPKNEQMIGRLRNIEGKKVFYFDVVDLGFRSCKNQLISKKQVYRKKAENIYEIEL